MPNKLFEYGMAGLPVIVSNMFDMAEYVQLNKCGLVLNELDVASVHNVIEAVQGENVPELSKRSYESACRNAWEVQEQKMLKAYNKILDVK